MNNRYIIGALAFLTVVSIGTARAQDTVKKTKPVVTTYKPKPKPVVPAYGTQPVQRSPYAAQQPVTPPVNTDKSLNGQYQYISTKFYNYQRPQLAAFYKNVTDTLRTERKKVKELQEKLSAQVKAVQDLKTDVSSKEQSLNESNSKADAISFLGVTLTKSLYNTIMWGLVIVFGSVATIVLLRSGSALREARYRTKLYDELDEEYKAYKVKANEKEKKLARELQTERNKLDELLGRG